jgi:hypothetical protein
MIQTMGFKDIKDMGKYEQGPSELPIIEKIPKGLGMRSTPNTPLAENGELHSIFTPPTNKKVECENMIGDLS